MNIYDSQKHLVNKIATPIHYDVKVGSITRHLFHIVLEVDTGGLDFITLEMPSWIPGSYMVRDFAKHIQWIEAEGENEKQLLPEKIDKQSFRIACPDAKVTIRYALYAFDLSVRSAFLDKEFGFANGTSLFFKVKELENEPVGVTVQPVEILPNWKLFTAMPATSTDKMGFGRFQCENYLDLIEHPLLFADAAHFRFEHNDTEFEMAIAGGVDADLERIKQDLRSIVAHHLRLFGKDIKLQRYLFITMLTEGGFGGLEHTESTALMFDRRSLPTKAQSEDMTDGYRDFLSLCSHEFFHTWHVKRIKPKIFLKPDLQQEVYTEQLWIYEGFTSYYDDFSLLRAGLIDKSSYLELLGRQLTRLHRNHGSSVQTVAESSYYAWSKFYKQDENASNAIVSYYNKGAIIALCLDLNIRSQSRGTYSLDSVMRFLWKHYGKNTDGTPDNVIEHILHDAMRLDCTEFLQQAVHSTDPLPYEKLLSEFGIKVLYRPAANVQDKGGKASSKVLSRDLGASYSKQAGGFKIQRVQESRAAQLSGLAKDDLIIAINGWQLGQLDFIEELQRLPLNTTAKLDLFRRGQLIQLHLPIMAAPEDTVYLEIESEQLSTPWLESGQES